MKKLIIFDCDGTLVDSEMIAARVLPVVWAEMGVHMTTDEYIRDFIGVASDADIVKRTLARLPANAIEISNQRFHEESDRSLEAVKGIKELLEKLQHPICVASNSHMPHIKKSLKQTGLDHFFGEKLFSARDLDKPKPEPDVYLHAAKTMGYTPDQCLVIEDSLTGIQAAKSAGMKVVGFMGGLHFNDETRKRLLSGKADHYCSTTLELEQAIVKWLTQN